ncbi:hypothetical protein G9A89_000231 [Geosiphon pyriformis]|nr:hypothetical protein G9A89_000231 [Geosiphon pyriformis]
MTITPSTEDPLGDPTPPGIRYYLDTNTTRLDHGALVVIPNSPVSSQDHIPFDYIWVTNWRLLDIFELLYLVKEDHLHAPCTSGGYHNHTNPELVGGSRWDPYNPWYIGRDWLGPI